MELSGQSNRRGHRYPGDQRRPNVHRATVRVRRRPPAVSGRVYQDDWGAIARIYDLEHPASRGAELRFWDQEARAGGAPDRHVLELAAGSGRITVALARKGHTVTGLELSNGMLERARGRAARLAQAARDRLTWVQGDMSRFSLGTARFGLIFVAYNSFWLLRTEAEQRACLACVRQHLSPDGQFVLDVFPPVADDYHDEAGLMQRLAMASRGRAIIRVKDYHYDTEARLGISDVRYYGERRPSKGARGAPGDDQDAPGRAETLARFSYALRAVPPDEVRTLLNDAGFKVLEEHGTYERGPIEPNSPRAIFVCRINRSPEDPA